MRGTSPSANIGATPARRSAKNNDNMLCLSPLPHEEEGDVQDLRLRHVGPETCHKMQCTVRAAVENELEHRAHGALGIRGFAASRTVRGLVNNRLTALRTDA